MSISDIITQAAYSNNVPQPLAFELFGAESSYDPNATNSTSGAMGLGQVLPSTAAQPGYGIQPLTDPYDPTANANFSLQYLSALYNKLGSWTAAVTGYYPNASTDPNYSGVVGAATAADSGSPAAAPNNCSFWQSVNPFSACGIAAAAGTSPTGGQIATGAAAKSLGIPSSAQVASFFGRAGIVVLGIGLLIVGFLALSRQTSIATEAARVVRQVRPT